MISTISPVCTPALRSCVDTFGWITTVMPARNGSSGTGPAGRLLQPEDRRQIAAAIAVQQIVDDGEARVLDHARGLDHLCRHRAVPQHRGDRVERRIGRRVQVAIKRRRLLADREAAQHLAGIIPERRADLGEHDVARSARCASDGNCAGTARCGSRIGVTPK